MTSTTSTDVYLIISFCILIIALLVANFYILVYWQSPEDKNEEYFPKALVVLGLTLAEASVLLLPLDVQNNSGDPGCSDGLSSNCGSLDFQTFWEVFFCLIAGCIILVIPFAIFYYESDDGLGVRVQSRFFAALKMEIAVIIASLLTLLLMFFFLGYTDIPVKNYTTNLSLGELYTIPAGFTSSELDTINTLYPVTTSNTSGRNGATVEILVSFSVYVIALIGWVGWFFFAIFSGVGLAALPFDLIAAFIRRPRHMDAVEFAEHQTAIQRRAVELIEVAELIRKERAGQNPSSTGWRAARALATKDRLAVNKLTQMVYVLEQDYGELKFRSIVFIQTGMRVPLEHRLCKQAASEYSPLIPFAKLFAGIVCIAISVLWWLHIILYMLSNPPVTLFLNQYFVWFNGWFPLFGTLSYTLFAFYMLACSIKGCFKVGVRFFLFKIHPMEPGKTLMNSFLFNLGVIMLCCIPCVQFCAQAFKSYATNADVNSLFGVQVTYMKWFKYWYNNDVFVWIILLLCGLTTVYLSIWPRDSSVSATKMRNKLIERRRAGA